jgi:hypothetical protein
MVLKEERGSKVVGNEIGTRWTEANVFSMS